MSLKRRRQTEEGGGKKPLQNGTSNRPLSAFERARAQSKALAETENIDEAVAAEIIVSNEDDVIDSDVEPHDVITEVQNVPLDPGWKQWSTWTSMTRNVLAQDQTSVTIRLLPGESVVNIGSYELRVLKGKIFVYGAELSARSSALAVHATCTAALPKILCISSGSADIRMSSVPDSVQSLKRLSPLFTGLLKLTERSMKDERTFDRVDAQWEDPLKRSIFPLHTPREWISCIQQIRTTSIGSGRPTVLLGAGPRSSGKSTFVQIVSNHLLSHVLELDPTIKRSSSNCASKAHTIPTHKETYILDLDSNNPRFTSPGQVSLIRLARPVLSSIPSFLSSADYEVVRAHSMPFNAQQENRDYVLSCTKDLIDTYHKSPSCSGNSPPLFIDTPSWTSSSDLATLADIIKTTSPRHIVHFGTNISRTYLTTLESAATKQHATVYHLPPQPNAQHNRTETQLQDMSLISYFHLQTPSSPSPTYTSTPLLSTSSLTVSFSPSNPGFTSLILSPSNPISASHLPTLLPHSILSLIRTTSPIPAHTSSPVPYTTTLPSPSTSHLLGLAYCSSVSLVSQTLTLHLPSHVVPLLADLAPSEIVLVYGCVPAPTWALKEAAFARYHDGLRRVRESGLFVGEGEAEEAERVLEEEWKADQGNMGWSEERTVYEGWYWGGIKLNVKGGTGEETEA